MANEVARLNKPTAFSGAEEEYSDGICADVIRGNDGRHIVDRAASGSSKPKSEASPDRRRWERKSEDALQYLGTADDEGTAKNGARGTRPKRVGSVPIPRVEIREQRRTR